MTPYSQTYFQTFVDSDKKKDDNSEAMLQRGTLQDLLDHAATESPVALNVLDLPLGGAAVPIPPMFTDLSTDAYAAPYVKDFVNILDLRDDLSWGTAATNQAFSWFHVDDSGFATVVYPQAGSKLWIIADRIRKDLQSDETGDIMIFDGWNVKDIDPAKWRLEAVHLVPSHVL